MCIGTEPTGKICLAKLSPASSWPRRLNTSTHHNSWVKKGARIVPYPVQTGVRLKARWDEIESQQLKRRKEPGENSNYRSRQCRRHAQSRLGATRSRDHSWIARPQRRENQGSRSE